MEGWDPIYPFNPATFLCLSQARTSISIVICHGLFCVQGLKVRGQFIAGGNREYPPTRHKSLINFITLCCIEYGVQTHNFSGDRH